jgi:hypothetical protein
MVSGLMLGNVGRSMLRPYKVQMKFPNFLYRGAK